LARYRGLIPFAAGIALFAAHPQYQYAPLLAICIAPAVIAYYQGGRCYDAWLSEAALDLRRPGSALHIPLTAIYTIEPALLFRTRCIQVRYRASPGQTPSEAWFIPKGGVDRMTTTLRDATAPYRGGGFALRY
jgi:hypothetical protein